MWREKCWAKRDQNFHLLPSSRSKLCCMWSKTYNKKSNRMVHEYFPSAPSHYLNVETENKKIHIDEGEKKTQVREQWAAVVRVISQVTLPTHMLLPHTNRHPTQSFNFKLPHNHVWSSCKMAASSQTWHQSNGPWACNTDEVWNWIISTAQSTREEKQNIGSKSKYAKMTVTRVTLTLSVTLFSSFGCLLEERKNCHGNQPVLWQTTRCDRSAVFWFLQTAWVFV